MKVSKKGSSVRRAFFMLVPVQKLFSEYFQKLSIRAVFFNIRLYGKVKAFCAGVLCAAYLRRRFLKQFCSLVKQLLAYGCAFLPYNHACNNISAPYRFKQTETLL